MIKVLRNWNIETYEVKHLKMHTHAHARTHARKRCACSLNRPRRFTLSKPLGIGMQASSDWLSKAPHKGLPGQRHVGSKHLTRDCQSNQLPRDCRGRGMQGAIQRASLTWPRCFSVSPATSSRVSACSCSVVRESSWRCGWWSAVGGRRLAVGGRKVTVGGWRLPEDCWCSGARAGAGLGAGAGAGAEGGGDVYSRAGIMPSRPARAFLLIRLQREVVVDGGENSCHPS